MKLEDSLWAAAHPGKFPGQPVRRMRLDHGITIQDAAKAARRVGLAWQPARWSDLESGRVQLTVETLVKVAQTMANITGSSVTLADLLDGHPYAPLLRGEPVTPDRSDDAAPTDVVRRNGYESIQAAAAEFDLPEDDVVPMFLALEDTGLPDQRTASELKLSVPELTVRCFKRYRLNFTQERDRRAGEGAHAAALGEATRAIRAELAE